MSRRVHLLLFITGILAAHAALSRVEASPLHDPGCNNVWTPTSTLNAPVARDQYVSLWTGSQMIIWGGSVGGVGQVNTGGRYSPATDSWSATSTTNAAAGRNLFSAVWTGTEMIVWGGYTAGGLSNTGGRYNPATNTWAPMSTTNAPTARAYQTAIWTGSEMIIWGGLDANSLVNTGGRYNPSTDTWVPLTTSSAPLARYRHTAIWTGSEMIIWGGTNFGSGALNTGGKYNPTTGTWSATTTTSAPAARADHTAVWTGNGMYVWGGAALGGNVNTGGIYDPLNDSWVASSTANAPAARSLHTAVWTGNQMIVWGGYNGAPLNTGGGSDPVTATWSALDTFGVPAARYNHTAIWTGSEMIVWGGVGTNIGTTGGRYCVSPSSAPQQPVPPADLVAQNITFSPSAVAPGASLTINWTLANIGTAAATGDSTTVVRITSSATSAGIADLATVATPPLSAGDSVLQSATVPAPSSLGTYYVWIIADRFDAVSQAWANDAQRSGPFTITASPPTLNISHDLVVLGIAGQNLLPNNPSLDAQPLLQAALDYVKTHAVQTLTLDKGSYYVLTQQSLFANTLANLTIDLAGSKIYFKGPLLVPNGLSCFYCTNVTIKNFEVDFINPPYTHVKLTSVNTQQRVITYQNIPGWPDPSTFNGLSVEGNWAAFFRNGDIVPGTSRTLLQGPFNGSSLQIQDPFIWAQSETLSTLQAGDTIVVTARGGGAPIQVWESDGVTVDNVAIYGSGETAIQLYQTKNSTVNNVRVMPRPNSGLLGSMGDGIHFLNVGGNNHLRNSYVTRMMDDGLVMDSPYAATVLSQSGTRQLTVRRHQYLRFPNGTLLNFVDPLTTLETSGAIITSQSPADGTVLEYSGQVSLTFDRDLPSLPAGTIVVFGTTEDRGSGSTIEDNIVEDLYGGRGIWMNGAHGITVQRNTVRRTSLAAIIEQQETDAAVDGNDLGAPAHDVVISDNAIENAQGPAAAGTGLQSAMGAITVISTDNTFGFSSSAGNTNITIARNYIADSGRSGLWIGEVNGGTVQDNLLIRSNQNPTLSGTSGFASNWVPQVMQDAVTPLVIHFSSNITQTGNTVADTSPIAAPVSAASAIPVAPPGGGSSSFSLTTAVAGFAWKATTSAAWISLSPPTSGSGTGTVSYSVSRNTTGQTRTGTIVVAGESFTITQAAFRGRAQLTSQ